MKIISWNVNGLRNATNTGLLSLVDESKADLLCLQEIKTTKKKYGNTPPTNYVTELNPAERLPNKYGTAAFMKKPPTSYANALDGYNDYEGRTQIIRYSKFCIINVYAPHAKPDRSGLNEKLSYLSSLEKTVRKLMYDGIVIICGDLNIYHECACDWFKGGCRPGKTIEEQAFLLRLLSIGFVDLIVEKNLDWSDLNTTMQDYFLIPKAILHKVKNVSINRDYFSDHYPIELDIDVPC